MKLMLTLLIPIMEEMRREGWLEGLGKPLFFVVKGKKSRSRIGVVNKPRRSY